MCMYRELIPHYVQWEQDWIIWQLMALSQAHSLDSQIDLHSQNPSSQLVRDALHTMGLPYTEFAGHSFRIGAVTAAAKAGMEDSVIRSLGRWNSSAFLIYVRTPRDELWYSSTITSHMRDNPHVITRKYSSIKFENFPCES